MYTNNPVKYQDKKNKKNIKTNKTQSKRATTLALSFLQNFLDFLIISYIWSNQQFEMAAFQNLVCCSSLWQFAGKDQNNGK